MKGILDFFRISAPSSKKVASDKVEKTYRRLRARTIIALTLGYALYYVCRLSMGVMKQPLIDAGLLTASQLGVVGACLYWAYAVGKLVNGFLADGANVRRFMATGLLISVLMNLVMGVLGIAGVDGGVSNAALFVLFCVCWAINGWAQSMGAPAAVVALSRWSPLKTRGTYYGLFSASHNIGEGLSFIFVGSLVAAAGWKWGFFGAALAGLLGFILVLFFFSDTPESKGLPSIEELTGEASEASSSRSETRKMQREVIKNPGVWILALASAFMYMSRYAINEWGIIFLQEAKGYSLAGASSIIGINPIFGVIGTVCSGWLSDKLFKGDRYLPAFVAGILESLALALFLFGGAEKWVNILAMILFGVAIGVLISFVGGLMAVDIAPRGASGAALGIVGLASYIAAGIQNVVTGLLMDSSGSAGHDFTYVRWFWLGAAVVSFLLPMLNWRRRKVTQ